MPCQSPKQPSWPGGVLLVQDMFLSMLFAGHDTGAHTIMRLFSELPRHRHVWDKLVAEQQEVPGLLCMLLHLPVHVVACGHRKQGNSMSAGGIIC